MKIKKIRNLKITCYFNKLIISKFHFIRKIIIYKVNKLQYTQL